MLAELLQLAARSRIATGVARGARVLESAPAGVENARRLSALLQQQEASRQLIRRLTMQQRVQRLQRAGAMLSREEVARRLGVEPKTVTLGQQVAESERRQQALREKAIQQMGREQEQRSQLLRRHVRLALVMGALPAAVMTLRRAFTSLGRTIEARARMLRQYSAEVNAALVELSVGRRLRDIRFAREAGPEIRSVLDALNDAERAWAPVRRVLLQDLAGIAEVGLRLVEFTGKQLRLLVQLRDWVGQWLAGNEDEKHQKRATLGLFLHEWKKHNYKGMVPEPEPESGIASTMWKIHSALLVAQKGMSVIFPGPM